MWKGVQVHKINKIIRQNVMVHGREQMHPRWNQPLDSRQHQMYCINVPVMQYIRCCESRGWFHQTTPAPWILQTWPLIRPMNILLEAHISHEYTSTLYLKSHEKMTYVSLIIEPQLFPNLTFDLKLMSEHFIIPSPVCILWVSTKAYLKTVA